MYKTGFHSTTSECSISHVLTGHVRVRQPELIVRPHKVYEQGIILLVGSGSKGQVGLKDVRALRTTPQRRVLVTVNHPLSYERCIARRKNAARVTLLTSLLCVSSTNRLYVIEYLKLHGGLRCHDTQQQTIKWRKGGSVRNRR